MPSENVKRVVNSQKDVPKPNLFGVLKKKMENNGLKMSALPTKSKVWRHFLYDKSCQVGKCNVCKKMLRATGRNTKGLNDHLKVHKVTFTRSIAEDFPLYKNGLLLNGHTNINFGPLKCGLLDPEGGGKLIL